VAFSSEAVVVTIVRRARLHRCARCEWRTRAAYDHRVSSWRHVALGKLAVTLRSTVARVDCPDHGVAIEAVPWAEAGSRFTRDFEDLVAWLAREMNKTAVARVMRLAWATVGGIIERVVARRLDEKRLDELYCIGLDEVSYKKGHKYLSIVADHRTGDPVWIGEGRSQRTVAQFFDELGPERTAKLEFVTMDMSAGYIAEVRARAPQAEIVFDPFHVVRLANDAVHSVRREEARVRAGSDEADVLKGARWSLLKSPETLSGNDRVRLAAVAALNKRVYRAYLLKEELRALFWCSARSARRHLDAWLAWASRSRLRSFVRLARTLRQHRDGILAAVSLGLSNGRMEGLNNKIAVLKHRAYGFHSVVALIAMIFLCCTKIALPRPTFG
jgi:transposase